MKVSYQLLKNWIGFKESPQAIAEIINLHITEVEEVISSSQYHGIVVGEIKEINPHPDADKLQLAKVDVGDKVLDIVCGASNIAVAQKVSVAVEGCVLPGGMEIRSAVIRGERSYGMICSKSELNLEKESEGIWVLDEKLKVGTPMSEVMGEDGDTVFDLKVLSNRPDYLSYLSIAREIAAALKLDFKPDIDLAFKEGGEKSLDVASVEIKDYNLCPRYIGRVVKNITVKPSPDWIQKVLIASGLRPINNVVDISNYVLLELGQPTHAFDLNKVEGNKFIVREAVKGETIKGLDGNKHGLDSSMLVIADAKKPLAVAGVVGGEDSSVTDKTKDILIEVANFDMVSIRNTSRALGVHTDSSARFERGLSVLLPETAMNRMINLIQKESPECEVLVDNIDINKKLPKPVTEMVIEIEKINQLAGIDIDDSEMVDILNRIDLPTRAKGNELTVQIPNYRRDIVGVADIAEEIIRIFGIDKIPYILPEIVTAPTHIEDIRLTVNQTKGILVKLGFIEIYLTPFDSGSQQGVRLEKPLVEHLSHLKSDLTRGVTEAEIIESNNRADSFRVFELNTIFIGGGDILPIEHQQLVARIKESDAYRKIRGVLDLLLNELDIAVEYHELNGLKGMRILIGKTQIGEVVSKNDRDTYLSLRIDMLIPHLNKQKTMKQLPKFPPIKFDMAFVVPARIRIGDVYEEIKSIDILVNRVELFDTIDFSEKEQGAAFHIEIRSDIKTLTREDRENIEKKIKNKLREMFKAELR